LHENLDKVLSSFFKRKGKQVSLSEKREVHATVNALLHEVWMVLELVLLTMLENKDAVIFQ
jgi:hypothetical protein